MHGLTQAHAEKLLEQYGHNEIADKKQRSLFLVFFDQLNNFLVLLLIAAAGISFFVGEHFDASLILSIVVLNALFGIYQEKKASDAIAALKNMTIVKVRVIREGVEQEIDSRYLVPGDVFFMEEGTKVPADAKLYESINLEINESALTGESLAIAKEKDEEVFMGTIVTKGRGYAQVVSTGMNTKFGQIAAHLSAIEETRTPLQKKLVRLSEIIGLLGIAISIVVFFLSSAQGATYFAAFLLAVSLSVAVVPEGLPAIMTITLALGVKEMAKKKAIVRKLSAIEALGSITLIATDKTGTLTQNKMNVKKIYVEGKEYDEEKLPSLSDKAFHYIVLDGILCSTASLVKIHDHGSFDVLGDPTEGALLYLAQKTGQDIEMVRSQWKLIEENPFDSITKTMTVTVDRDGQTLMLRKGALESILIDATHVMRNGKKEVLSDEYKMQVERQAEAWASKGLRLLAFSYSDEVHKNKKAEMIFLGMVAIHDPPREESKEAIRRANKAGIKVVMITGDNEKTAEAIGVVTGLMQEGDEILTGRQVEEYSDEQLMEKLPNVKIFARTTPFHKSRIVKLYQQLGEVVAVTGDGVNDAIALKQADVGIAMGRVGTDVARETADMVITDDNFATIVNAVEEGRSIVRNLSNSVKYLLTGNLSEALALVFGLIIGIPQLFFPIQILYTNLISDGFPALAVAFSPKEEGIMNRPPKKQEEFLNGFDKKYIFSVGTIGACLVIACYFLFLRFGHEVARTAAFCMLVCMQSYLFIDIWLDHRSMRKHLKGSLSVIFFAAFLVTFGIQYLVVSIPAVSKMFEVVNINLGMYTSILVLSAVYLVFIKVVKLILRTSKF